MEDLKSSVRDYWQASPCGRDLYLQGTPSERENFLRQEEVRYTLEPYIKTFADFASYNQKQVLEIGVGLGADHLQFARAGAVLHGIDLTTQAIEYTGKRLEIFGLASVLAAGDAEHLAFPDNTFDLVYSWGVLHHSPDTPQAIREAYRVLKPGGHAKIMIYHTYSLVGYMLWLRYALLRGRPWMSLKDMYFQYLESPGTKAYSCDEARALCAQFSRVDIETVLTHGDLLASQAGQRHRGWLLTLAKRVWPRKLLAHFCKNHGLFMLITAKKA